MTELRAQDLRIGNWVYDVGGIPAQIKKLNDSGKILLDKPIPLTEDWLIRFGFEKPEYSPYWHSPHDDSSDYVTGLWDKHVFDLNDMEYIINQNPYDADVVKCDSVHTLMNLYHSLTGTELQASK